MWFQSLKFWCAIAVILGFIGLLAFGLTSNPKHVPSPLVGKPAPEFTVVSMDGKASLRLSDLRGKPVVLNFWASWCLACQTEARILKSYHLKYDKQEGRIRVLGIAIQDQLLTARAFALRFGKEYFLALDDEKGSIALDYGIYGVPETFFIDARGIVQDKHVGELTEAVMAQEVQALLEATTPAN